MRFIPGMQGVSTQQNQSMQYTTLINKRGGESCDHFNGEKVFDNSQHFS